MRERMAENRARLQAAGLAVLDFPPLAYTEVGGEEIAASYLNFYLCNGGVVVPVAGDAADADALQRIAAAYPDREVVGVRGEVIAAGGGGPHCITQQVPRRSAPSGPAARPSRRRAPARGGGRACAPGRR